MALPVQIPIPADERDGVAETATVAPAPPETPRPASPASLQPSPQPSYAVIDESQFADELHKMDLESELALAEEGLAEYLGQCPPY